jgi:hypothetical protein
VKTIIFKYFSVFLFLALILQSCDDNITFQPKGNYVSGYVFFADTHFVEGNGNYAVALYPVECPAFSSKPLCTQYIDTKEANYTYFRVSWEGEAKLMLAVVWKFDSTIHRRPLILGTYGCDTTHGCSTHKLIEFPNFTGYDFNIISWADTSKKLF